jgi:hypothetical protein
MSRRVIFKTLWLASERDLAGRKQHLQSKNLLLGSNATGKSRIIKNLFWAFGCDPVNRNQGEWDPDAIAAVEFEFNSIVYMVLRDGNRLGMFSEGGGSLLFSAENMRAWASFTSSFFGYSLNLKRPSSTSYSRAGVEYLTLPFYLDQDGSWGTEWNTYAHLKQFSSWKTEVFEAFTGLWPNAYFDAKRRHEEVSAKIREKLAEKEAQRQAFKSVKEILPKNLPSLDLSTFRRQLADIGQKAVKVQKEQVKLRGQLLAAVNLRATLEAELALARNAQKELMADISYLAEVPSKSLECPTCGTVHEKSFHARLELAQDSESTAELVAELSRKLVSTREEESSIRGDMRKMAIALAEIDSISQERKTRLRLDEVLASHSKKTLDVAFRRVSDDANEALNVLGIKEANLAVQVRKFKDKTRQDEIREYFSSQVASLSSALNVPAQEQLRGAKPGGRAQAGGSGAPRSILAIHLALLRCNERYGDTAMFPFVVDTPQQSGQDFDNLKRMIEIAGESASQDHQVILAVETLPSKVNVDSFNIIEFDLGHRALERESYNEVVSKLRSPLSLMRDSINKRKRDAESEISDS